jgi:hypothetical protein
VAEEDATTEEEDATTEEEDAAKEDAAEDDFSAAGAAGAASSLEGNVSEVRMGDHDGRRDFTEVGVSPERTQPVMSVRALGQVTFSQSTSGLWML